MVKQHPENAYAHFTLGYVPRYAGMPEESTRECEAALALDPGNFQFRSCSWAFMELGKTDRARDFIRLDAGSEWANYAKLREAREAVKKMPVAPRYHPHLLKLCLDPQPLPELGVITQQAETTSRPNWTPRLHSIRRPSWRFAVKRRPLYT